MKTFKQKFNKKYKQPLAKSNSLKEISKLSGYKLSGLQKVYNKGTGAFKTAGPSRPNMTKQSWSYARVYAAVSKGSKTYKIDKDLLIKKKKT
tara:strand:+ start:2124 stop:2399 length:276 start_codon:yes stop_codon:yes gene_type:complete